ncbi:Uncharacterised protein [Mycobacterium tuberculosis]|nr:Uncharacterised protein [Mycobacterium tuberculosis]
MPGRFREGTETCIRKVRTLETLPTCRQTQNPERGRKLEIQHHIRSCGMLPKSSDPKPREGTETLMVGHGRARLSGSSDPKPREGTETGRRIAPGAGGAAVVRPKTPRGDGNARNRPTWACPQRVVRPKTPRGDGNTETQHQPDNLILASSDPKPREGTETPRGWRMRCARKCRQTQNPERGRKLVRHLCLIQVQCPVVRPKTPRGDGNPTMASKSAWVTDPGRQTQNPERGRKLRRLGRHRVC